MTDLQTYSLTGIIAYFALMIGIGILAGRRQNAEGFIIGNRQVGILPTAASIGTNFRDAASLWFWISLSYLYGYAPVLLFMTFFAAAAVIGYFGPSLRRRAAAGNFVSVGQMLRESFGPVSQKFLAMMLVCVSFSFAAAQLFIVGQILGRILNVPEHVVIPAISLVVLFYLIAGGYLNVVRTDFIQFFMIAALLSVPFFLPVDTGDLTDFGSLGTMGRADTLGLLIMGFIGAFGNVDIYQRIFSARDDRTARWGPLLGIVAAVLCTAGIIMIGLALRGVFPDAGGSQDLLFDFFESSAVSPALLAMILVSIFAMGMSSLDTHTYLFTSSVLRDLSYVSTSQNRGRYVLTARILMVVMLSAATLLALLYEDLVQVMMAVVGLWAVMGAVTFFSLLPVNLCGKLTDYGMSAVLLIGGGIFAWGVIGGWSGQNFLINIVPAMATFALAALVALAGLINSRRKQNGTAASHAPP